MPAFHAEIQVGGQREPLDTLALSLSQPTDYLGRPNGGVRVWPLQITLTGPAAGVQFFLEWALDSYMRRSGHIVAYEEGKARWRLAFYDAWCILHETSFRPGNTLAAHSVTLNLSPAAIAVNGVHSEIHSDLWWEKDAANRFNALTKPADLLPTPALAATLQPPAAAVAPPLLSPLTGAPLAPKPPKTALVPENKPRYAPIIDKWYQKGGRIELLNNGNWQYTDWEHNSVEYEGDEPNFDKYARQQVDIEDMQGNCTTDFDKADAEAPEGPIVVGNTWHHKQNVKTMQEVDEVIHQRFTHYGARHVLKRQRNSITPPVKRKRI